MYNSKGERPSEKYVRSHKTNISPSAINLMQDDHPREMKDNSKHVTSPTSVPWKENMVKEEREYLRPFQWQQSPECACSELVHYYKTPWWVLYCDKFLFPFLPQTYYWWLTLESYSLTQLRNDRDILAQPPRFAKRKWFSAFSNRKVFFSPRVNGSSSQ